MSEATRHYSVSASAVVIRPDGRFLAVHRRDTGAWVLPGGVVEPGEAITDAAIREVAEETGVHVSIDRLSGIYQNLATNVVSFVFRATPRMMTTSVATPEADRIRWITPDDADDLMADAFIQRVHNAYKNDGVTLTTFAAAKIMTPKNAAG